MNFLEDLKMLRSGILPESLRFTIGPKEPIDWRMVQYINKYKTFEFHHQKFKGIGGMDAVIQHMADTARTPLEEMHDRHDESHNIIRNINLFSELNNLYNYIDE